MRVLWFSPNPAGYKFDNKDTTKTYGSWTSSLQSELIKREDVVLGICFCAENQPQRVTQDGVIYYPVARHQKSYKDKFLDLILFKDEKRDKIVWPYYIEKFKMVIEDFHPDVIQVFGSELYIGLATFSSIHPLTLHIQGILNSITDVYFPPGCSKRDYILQDINPFKIWKRYINYLWWLRNCYRERMVIQHTRHFIGRTEWDKRVISVLNPEANYHFGEEIMRSLFYKAGLREIPNELVINSVVSSPFYKGFDLVLKVANLLKNYLHLGFTWNVYGSVFPTFVEKQLGLKHKDLNVVLHGVVSADILCASHLKSTVYVHPSYIENGCNAIIEAQMCSCSVIANYVGGLNTTIKHGDTGFLTPANDAYQMAYLINYLYLHPRENREMGERAYKDAIIRHDKKKIVSDLLHTYKTLIENSSMN